ncbi:MAG: type VI secretion system tip protein VgrG [Chitinophagales bacterium]
MPNNETKFEVTNFIVKVDGKEIQETYQVLSADVHKAVNRIASARVILLDGDVSTEEFEASDSDTFKPGAAITIITGHDSDSRHTVFEGIVIKHSVKIRRSGVFVLTIDCKDKAIKATKGRKNKYFYKKKDSDIIKEVLQETGLNVNVEATNHKHDEMIQYHSSNWDFINTRAELNGMLVVNDDGKIDIKAPKLESPVFTAKFGKNLLEFEGEIDVQNQLKGAKSKSWKYANQGLVEAAGSTSFSNALGGSGSGEWADILGQEAQFTHSGRVSEQELKEWANTKMMRSELSKVRGRAKFQGSEKIKPGTTVKLEGVGKKFSGDAFVSAVSHSIADGEWMTDVEFGLSPQTFTERFNIGEKEAGGLLPPIQGLQIGKVTKLENDPDGEDRVLIRVPIIDMNEDGVWARVSTLDAGKDRGSFFRPEIDDEVIVGFLNSDPRDAIILGMLHSSANAAPLKAEDVNHEKGFFTRDGMRVLFNDEKKIITIDTPAKNQIIISEEDKGITIIDQNKNKIVTEPSGITIESKGNIDIKAKGDIKIDAMNITTKVKMAAKVEGVNITEKATAQFKAEGSASVNLSSNGITMIKGSLVKIN